MDNQKADISNFDFKIIADFFKGLYRQGPGSDEQTIKALGFIPELTSMKRIADIGCGTGAQTQVLATHTQAEITANDLLPEMLEGLNKRMVQLGMENRVTPILSSMTDLSFADESLDLIWAEGSIYNIGFEKGFAKWKQFIKKGGYIAVSECCWLSAARPAQMDYFSANFPEIESISAKLGILERLGYIPVAHFILPESCWLDNYFTPIKGYMETFRKQYRDNPMTDTFIKFMKKDILHYQTYKEYYGYVFFIVRKPQ